MADESKPAFLADYNTEQEQAAALGCSDRALKNWRRDKVGPPYTIVANRIYYFRPSTVAWLRAKEQLSKANAA